MGLIRRSAAAEIDLSRWELPHFGQFPGQILDFRNHFWRAEADEFKEMFRCSRDCSFKEGPGRLIGTLCS